MTRHPGGAGGEGLGVEFTCTACAGPCCTRPLCVPLLLRVLPCGGLFARVPWALPDELIRQVTLESPERGLLLLRVRDEIRMTLDAYKTLYDSRYDTGTQPRTDPRRVQHLASRPSAPTDGHSGVTLVVVVAGCIPTPRCDCPWEGGERWLLVAFAYACVGVGAPCADMHTWQRNVRCPQAAAGGAGHARVGGTGAALLARRHPPRTLHGSQLPPPPSLHPPPSPRTPLPLELARRTAAGRGCWPIRGSAVCVVVVGCVWRRWSTTWR
jgi:hypothetical protein